MSFFGAQLVLVDEINEVSSFLESILSDCQVIIQSPPKSRVNYTILTNKSKSSSVILVKRSDCDANVLAALGTISMARLFVDTDDMPNAVASIKKYKGNLRIFENRLGDANGPDLIVAEGPERIIIHVVNLRSGKKESSSSPSPPTKKAKDSIWSKPIESDDSLDLLIAKCDFMLESLIDVAQEEVTYHGDDPTEIDSTSGPPREKTKLTIPTLDVHILSDNSANFVRMPPNSKHAFPFETAFFKGTAVLTVLHPTMDSHFNQFYPDGKKRQFEVQVQGKFKRLPEGEVFVGAESMNKMEMGWMTRSFSNMALRFAGTMVNDLHYSFGDDQKNNPNYELPHIVAPIFPTLDKIIENEPNDGAGLPEMAVPFKENLEYRKKRFKWTKIKDAKVDLETTYSFSVNTSNIDLPNWEICNIPMCNPMPLTDFIGDSGVRLVAYEIPGDVVEKYKTHPQKYCNYVFNIELKSVCAQQPEDEPLMGMEIASEDEPETEKSNSPSLGINVNSQSGAIKDSLKRNRSSKPEEVLAGIRKNSQVYNGTPGEFSGSDSADEFRVSALSSSNDADDDEEEGDVEEDVEEERDFEALMDEGDVEEEEEVGRTRSGSNGAGLNSGDDDNDNDGEKQKTEKKGRFRIPSMDVARNRSRSIRDSIIGRRSSSTGDSGGGGASIATGGVGALGSNLKDWMSGFTNNIHIPAVKDIAEDRGEYRVPSFEFESASSSRYCPMIIEVVDKRIIKNRTNTFLYLLPYHKADVENGTNKDSSSGEPPYLVRLRSYEEVSKYLPMQPIPKLYKNKLMVVAEKRRRQIALSYESAILRSNNRLPKGVGAKEGYKDKQRLTELLHTESNLDRTFLVNGEGDRKSLRQTMTSVGAAVRNTMSRSSASASNEKGKDVIGESSHLRDATSQILPSDDVTAGTGSSVGAYPDKIIWSACTAVAMSTRHWIQFVILVTEHGIVLRQASNNKPMKFPLKTILSAGRMKETEVPCSLVGYSFFYFETIHKFYYLMLKDNDTSTTQSFLDVMKFLNVTHERRFALEGEQLEDAFSQTLLMRNKMDIYKLGKRSLYNSRRIVFRSDHLPDPSTLSEDLLAMALRLSELWSRRNRVLSPSGLHGEAQEAGQSGLFKLIEQWLLFLDTLSDLQAIPVVSMSETAKAAFFLNIYHVMVIHGSLVLFPPQTSANWQPFFHDVVYLLSFDVLSIAELEHNVIKASMTKPPRLALGLGRNNIAPRSIFPGFALRERDFRYNFCVNNGSLSLPGKICIYQPGTLDAQLDEMTSYVITEIIAIDEFKRVVTLPIVCSWHALDFVPRGASASNIDTLRTLSFYCNPQQKTKLTMLLQSGTAPMVKFKAFTFKSRHLSLK